MTTREIAKQLHVDPSTVRRWPAQGCPVLRLGSRGPGNAVQFDLQQVLAWRERKTDPVGLAADEVLSQIAQALFETLERDHADIRAGCSKPVAAGVLLVAWEHLCKTFGVKVRPDDSPGPIRALRARFVE